MNRPIYGSVAAAGPLTSWETVTLVNALLDKSREDSEDAERALQWLHRLEAKTYFHVYEMAKGRRVHTSFDRDTAIQYAIMEARDCDEPVYVAAIIGEAPEAVADASDLPTWDLVRVPGRDG